MGRKWNDGWLFFDPYDPEFKAPLLSNIADKKEFDDQFPNSPLSRAREILLKVKEKIKLSKEMINADYFFPVIE